LIERKIHASPSYSNRRILGSRPVVLHETGRTHRFALPTASEEAVNRTFVRWRQLVDGARSRYQYPVNRILVSGACVVGLVLGVALLVKASRRGAGDRLASLHLGLAMLVFADSFLSFLLVDPPHRLHSVYFRLHGASQFLFAPFFYNYFAAKTGRLRRGHDHVLGYAAQYLPFAVFAIAWGADVSPLGLTRLLRIGRPLPNLLINLQSFITITFMLRHFRSFSRALRDHASNLERKNLAWLRALLWLFCALLAVDTGVALAAWVQPVYLDLTPVYAVLTLGFGFMGFVQPEIFAGDLRPEDVAAAPAAEPHVPLAGTEEATLSRLLTMMATEQPHKDPLLTLPKLARRLAVRPQQLSRVINAGTGTRFYDFINGYRVRAVCDQLRAGGAESVLDVALSHGFNAKSTFYEAFRRETGITPGQWARDQRTVGDDRARVPTKVGQAALLRSRGDGK
jgi:AraC-like DNA-binding protein